MNMAAPVNNMSPKTKRLSMVALAGAVMAVIWVIIDSWFEVDAVFVSTVTSLVMLLAGFVDHKNPPTYDGEDDR